MAIKPAPVFLAMLALSAQAFADICVSDIRDNGSVVPGTVYPNWHRVHVASFEVRLCRECAWEPDERLAALTVANYGSLPGSGLSGVYWSLRCGKVATAPAAMTYAGDWTQDGEARPAWTWAGESPDLAFCPDLCGATPCGAAFTLDLYASLAPCARQDSTISLGLPAISVGGESEPGSLLDTAGCTVPVRSLPGPLQRIAWARRVGGEGTKAGDTVAYSIYYGRPGAGGLSSVCLLETLAPGAEYVRGSAVPAPDRGWGPRPGSPAVLRWTLGPMKVTGGRTSSVTFRVVRGMGEGTAGVFWPDSTCGEKPGRKKGIWDR